MFSFICFVVFKLTGMSNLKLARILVGQGPAERIVGAGQFVWIFFLYRPYYN